jgi:hypothetical protein
VGVLGRAQSGAGGLLLLRLPQTSARLGWYVAAAVAALAAALFLGSGGGKRSVTPTYSTAFAADRPTLDRTRFGGGLVWKVEQGTFASQDGIATGSASGSGPAFATVRPEHAGVLKVSFAQVTAGSGIVFRYRDARDYWSVVCAPEFGTWNIEKTVVGETSFVANTGNNLVTENTTIELRQEGSVVTINVDGKPSMRIDDRAFVEQPRVGLLSSTRDQAGTRWRSVSVTETVSGRAGG